MNFTEITTSINEAFFKFENFMKGTMSDYEYFGFNIAFRNLFREAKKTENFTLESCMLIDNYLFLIRQLCFDLEQFNVKNIKAWDNKDFCKDRSAIIFLSTECDEDFDFFAPTYKNFDNYERKISITDIVEKTPVLTLKSEIKAEQPYNKTEILEKCTQIMGHWVDENDTVFDKLLKPNIDFDKVFVIPFRKELNKNLFNTESKQGKEDIIRHYMHEFHDVQGLFLTSDEILSTGSLINYSTVKYKHKNENGITRTLNKYENYVVNCHYLYQLIFDEIEISCNKYKIDYKDLCIDLKFADKYLDYRLTGIDNGLDKDLIELNKEQINEIEVLLGFNTEYPIETKSSLKTETSVTEIKPIFNPEAILRIFDLLKPFFIRDHQIQLKQILEIGNDATEPLIFLDNGNRLADAFKQLIKVDIITGCKQKDLENWIGRNFRYIHRKQIKSFTTRYLSDIISTNNDKCQNPILNVKRDKETGMYLINKA